MPWREMSAVLLREEFIALCGLGGRSVAECCRRFGISRKTGCKWLARARAGEDLADRSRRPRCSPRRTQESVERIIVEARDAHPVWGARKLRAWLAARTAVTLPSASTISVILARHGRITPEASAAATPWQRFERERPNELWQMDFKGHVGMTRGGRCHPLTVLDDHARFCVTLQACGDEREETVRSRLREAFRVYGLPERILCDNGPPWGAAGEPEAWTALEVWLLKLGVQTTHGRPRHPQTQGKDERFHRTLKGELLKRTDLRDLGEAQRQFDRWRREYNEDRPHESLGHATPSTRYAPSPRPYPEREPEVEYDRGDAVRRVGEGGIIHYECRRVRVGRALEGERVAVKPTARHGIVTIYLGPYKLGEVDLAASASGPRRRPSLATLARPAAADRVSATHVSEHPSPMSPA